VKVALGGDGGDELWAGYPTYLAHRFAHAYRHIPRPLRDRVLHPLVSRFPLRDGYQSLEWKLKRFASRWDDHDLTRHLRWMSNTDLPDLSRCFPEPLAWPHGVARLTKRAAGTSDTLNQILALDLATYLPGAVLTKVDRASMIHGLEVRPPMLDESLIDFAFSLPSSMKLRGRTTKFLLKQVATQLLPDRIVHRKKKGFAIPLARWLKGPLRCRLETVIHESPLWQTSLLNRATFQQWFAEHQAGQIDRSKPLWALLVLDHWHTRISDPAPASRAPAQAVPAQ
jgi:asparagine synthase (glutamine-hydrolysing)